MGLVSLSIGFAAASLAASTPQAEAVSTPAAPEGERAVAALPSFPHAEAPRTAVLLQPRGAAASIAYPRIVAPLPAAERERVRSLDWRDGSAATKLRVNGLRLGLAL